MGLTIFIGGQTESPQRGLKGRRASIQHIFWCIPKIPRFRLRCFTSRKNQARHMNIIWTSDAVYGIKTWNVLLLPCLYLFQPNQLKQYTLRNILYGLSEQRAPAYPRVYHHLHPSDCHRLWVNPADFGQTHLTLLVINLGCIRQPHTPIETNPWSCFCPPHMNIEPISGNQSSPNSWHAQAITWGEYQYHIHSSPLNMKHCSPWFFPA